MADSSSSTSFNNTHLQDPNPPPFSSSMPTKPPKSKFHFTHYFFSKSLIIILVLLVFSFFSSQVPEFFKKTTIVTKLWELFYLLIIGIAVCYGLFSRKMDRVHSSDEFLAHSNDDNNGQKETYLSGISHISSIFEDGIQTSYGFDEKDLFEEFKGFSRLSELGNGFRKSDEKKLNQYFLGESMVVINDEKYVLEQLSKPKTIKQNNKGLNLPLRRVGSKSLDSGAGKSSSNGGGCDSVVNDYSIGGNGIKNRKFKGLVPIKLEEKFEDSDSDSGSPIPLNWRSKSMRLEKREDLCSDEANESSNSRPISVGVLDFEELRSKSMRFSMPTEIKNTHLSAKEILKDFGDGRSSKEILKDSSNHGSSKEILKVNHGSSKEILKVNHGSSKEILKDFGNHGSSKEILKDYGNHGNSKEILKGNDGSSKEILKDFGNHGSSKEILKGNHGSSKEILKDYGNHGSSKEILKGNHESFKETLKDFGNHGSSKEILKDFGNHGSSKEILKDFSNHGSSKEILKSFGNHGSSKEILKDSSTHGSSKEILKDFGNHGSSKEILKDFGKIKVEGGTLDSKNKASFIESNNQRSSIGSSSETKLETFEYALGKEEKLDSSNSSPKTSIFANTYKKGKSVRTNRPKEQVVEAKVKIFPNQTEENLDDIEPHSGEVDRKAEEFIAKFREQIRLQQVASARRLNL